MHNEIGQELELSAEPRKLLQLLDLLVEPEQITQEHIDFMLSKIPRGRFVETREIAAMVAWLSSAENSFTTGAVFDLSGGRATY